MAELKNAYQDLDLESAKNTYLMGLQAQHNIPDHIFEVIADKYRQTVEEGGRRGA